MQRRIEIRRGPVAVERRERRRVVVEQACAGPLDCVTPAGACGNGCSCDDCVCEGVCTCSCADCTCSVTCLCGCDSAEITEEDEGSHTLIKIRVPKVERPEGDEDQLVKAAGVSDAVEGLSVKVGELARAARTQGATWKQIGDALGISKQAAWERFSGEE